MRPRLALIAAAVAALALSVSSAARDGSGPIALSFYNDGRGVILLVNPDGSGRTTLRQTGLTPRWSRDGMKLAGVQLEAGRAQLFVLNADGSGDRIVASSTSGLVLSNQPWSPDGSRLAYLSDGSIYTASAAGGDVRLVATGADEAPVWSPTADLLAYTGAWRLYVIAPDGTGRRELAGDPATNRYPAWSPDGGSIAFLRATPGEPMYAPYVVRPDGTELHKVASVDGVLYSYLAWSPDGRQIAFSGKGERWTEEILTVNADGSHLVQLTDLGGDQPSWSPDGDQMLFRSRGLLMRMNKDGTCEESVATSTLPALSGWSWRPIPDGPPIGIRRCSAVGLEYETSEVRDGSFLITVQVVNEGTELLESARLVASPGDALELTAPDRQCSTIGRRVSCLTAIGRGESRSFSLRARARRFSRDRRSSTVGKVDLRVTAGETLPTGREAGTVLQDLRACSVRDGGRGRIDGSPYGDHICGRAGRDLIHPGLGFDVVDAGAGNDVVFTAADYQTSDRVSCGRGRDLVVADREDRVARNCERVVRRR